MPSPPSLGRILRSMDADAARVIETVHPAGLYLPYHDHEHASVNLTWAGRYEEKFPHRCIDSGPATVVIKPAGIRHFNRYGTVNTHCIMVDFGARALEWDEPRASALGDVWTARGGPAAAAMREVWSELRIGDSASRLIIDGCISRILEVADRRRRPRRAEDGSPKWLVWVEEFLHAHATRPVRLNDLARLADVHPGHLCKAFKRQYRVSVGCYQRRLQVDVARRRLLESADTVARVAAEAGFADQSHFGRVFKAQFGVSPAEYRRLADRPALERRILF